VNWHQVIHDQWLMTIAITHLNTHTCVMLPRCLPTCIHFITCTLAKPYAPCGGGVDLPKSRLPTDSSNLSLTPTACNDFSWSLHIFHFSQLYFWSIVELAPLKLSGTGDNSQLRVERGTPRTIVLVGHTTSSARWRRGLYVQRGTVHSLHCKRGVGIQYQASK